MTQVHESTTQMQQMVNEVKVDGRDVFVIVPNIKQFKAKAVDQLTTRPNKRRTPEKRFNWLFYTFVRETLNQNPELARKHVSIHLLSATKQDGMFRDEKGAFVTMQKLKAVNE